MTTTITEGEAKLLLRIADPGRFLAAELELIDGVSIKTLQDKLMVLAKLSPSQNLLETQVAELAQTVHTLIDRVADLEKSSMAGKDESLVAELTGRVVALEEIVAKTKIFKTQ